MIYFVLLSAILPAIILVWAIYKKDNLQPEPKSQIIKGVFWGVLSLFIALIIEFPLMAFWGAGTGLNIIDGAYNALIVAAIPEEVAKLFCLHMFLRKNKYFDEYMDGIVYAVCIGMGFAGFENIMYLFNEGDGWITLGVIRAFISVPGHYAFAILMGYFYSHWRILNDQKSKYYMLGVPIIAHAIFDVLLMWSQGVAPVIMVCIFVAFVFFLRKMHKHCDKLIAQQINFDKFHTGLS